MKSTSKKLQINGKAITVEIKHDIPFKEFQEVIKYAQENKLSDVDILVKLMQKAVSSKDFDFTDDEKLGNLGIVETSELIKGVSEVLPLGKLTENLESVAKIMKT